KDLKSDNRGLAYLISLQKYLECVVYGSVYNVVNLELHKEIKDLFQDMCMSTTFKGLEILRIG
ncbi:8231_t:CDS:2, partial [Entrophospora sp. SA101]